MRAWPLAGLVMGRSCVGGWILVQGDGWMVPRQLVSTRPAHGLRRKRLGGVPPTGHAQRVFQTDKASS